MISDAIELDGQEIIPKEAPVEKTTSIINRAKGIGMITIAILCSVSQGILAKFLKDIPTGEFIIIT